jgi:hypothetical protein
MGNQCETVNCCRKNEKSQLELLQMSGSDLTVGHRYKRLMVTKETMQEIPSDSNKNSNIKQFENGCIYEGDWDAVKRRHGFGIYKWSDGMKYSGYWVNNAANGFGKLEVNDREFYEGNWLNDKAHGFGEYRNSEGTIYKGEWKDDLQHGHGSEIWSNMASYEGEYFLGKKKGKGILKFDDNAYYEVD